MFFLRLNFLRSFFPNILQPAISTLVNPIHRVFLRVGVIKAHAPLKNSTSSSLTSVVSIPGVDMHDMERRRQIALKALSERLARTTDASRQNMLPKSFPHHHQHQQHQHQHQHQHHQHHHHGSDSNQPPFIATSRVPQTFIIPAIPLPPPPSASVPIAESTQQNAIGDSNNTQQVDTQTQSNLIDLNASKPNSNTSNNL